MNIKYNMVKEIDIVSNVKITNSKRLHYYLCVLNGISFLKNHCNLWINLEDGKHLVKPISKYLKKLGFSNFTISSKKGNYGEIYLNMLNQGKAEYILNLEDDHFMIMNDPEEFFDIINFAFENKVDNIPATFFEMIRSIYAKIPKQNTSQYGSVIDFNQKVFNLLNWNERNIYCGTNCINSRTFALWFWSEKHDSTRPHPFEKTNFQPENAFTLMVLEKELMRPIDDDHGVPNSCCLKNTDNKKWNKVFNEVNTTKMWKWKLSNYLKI